MKHSLFFICLFLSIKLLAQQELHSNSKNIEIISINQLDSMARIYKDSVPMGITVSDAIKMVKVYNTIYLFNLFNDVYIDYLNKFRYEYKDSVLETLDMYRSVGQGYYSNEYKISLGGTFQGKCYYQIKDSVNISD